MVLGSEVVKVERITLKEKEMRNAFLIGTKDQHYTFFVSTSGECDKWVEFLYDFAEASHVGDFGSCDPSSVALFLFCWCQRACFDQRTGPDWFSYLNLVMVGDSWRAIDGLVVRLCFGTFGGSSDAGAALGLGSRFFLVTQPYSSSCLPEGGWGSEGRFGLMGWGEGASPSLPLPRTSSSSLSSSSSSSSSSFSPSSSSSSSSSSSPATSWCASSLFLGFSSFGSGSACFFSLCWTVVVSVVVLFHFHYSLCSCAGLCSPRLSAMLWCLRLMVGGVPVVQWNHVCFGIRGVSKCMGSNSVHGPSVGWASSLGATVS
ncbi:hypothetical protein E2C01_032348 [Portunus trituberculatus]|uniref:PH domain-containing protein n=1 Tax=Portunus trituberculatus TaxID=210409 RepID=A0A5B7EVS5_PORTR|nr:hypothetical protein [Portunus trituberculatus]